MAISKIAVTNKESNMKSNAFKILLLSSAIAGMSGTASAQTFTATATVQNAVNITQTTALNFGTVFASKTSAHATAPTANSSDKLTLANDTGVISRTAETDADTSSSVLSLGGGAAGVFTAPGLPSSSKVQVILKAANGNPITNATSIALAACAYDTKVAATGADKVVLSISDDPNAGFFCVDAFTNNKSADLFTTTGYVIPFGATSLDFNLGATLVQQAVTGAPAAQLAYNPGAYTGSFGMEITFP